MARKKAAALSLMQILTLSFGLTSLCFYQLDHIFPAKPLGTAGTS